MILFNVTLLFSCFFYASLQARATNDLDSHRDDDVIESTLDKQPILANNNRIRRAKTPSVAREKCQQYSALAKKYSKGETAGKNATPLGHYVIDGKSVELAEFPHMALIFYGDKVMEKQWICGGTLISEKWILTAAHCYVIVPQKLTASWARLGAVNVGLKPDGPTAKDYRIVQHVLYPDYKTPSIYSNDVALFRLEKNVEFSAYIRPICLNTDSSVNPTSQIATIWERRIFDENEEEKNSVTDAIKLNVNTVPIKKCNSSYQSKVNSHLPYGIMGDTMFCASSIARESGKECRSDSGGPLQAQMDVEKPGVYTLFGFTSFGSYCGKENIPDVYTKVAAYTSWIESIVWS